MKKNKKNITNKAKEAANEFATEKQLSTDPMGSYTGKPKNKDEIPVQDADDL